MLEPCAPLQTEAMQTAFYAQISALKVVENIPASLRIFTYWKDALTIYFGPTMYRY